MKQTTLRGKILEFLKNIYPEGADERTVIGIFYDYHKVTDIEQSLAYLADKCLASVKDLPHPYKSGERVKIYRISPTGIDLMEGTITDAGVNICPDVD